MYWVCDCGYKTGAMYKVEGHRYDHPDHKMKCDKKVQMIKEFDKYGKKKETKGE